MRKYGFVQKTIILTVAVILMGGCMPAKRDILKNSHTLIPSPTSFPSSTAETQNEQLEYRLISSTNGMLENGGALSKDGFYELVYAKDVISGAQNIVYTDFASKHRIYLSSDVNSDHQSESDTSYIPPATGGFSIFSDEEFVYVFQKGSLVLQDSHGELARPCIYRINSDGSNRVTLELPFDQVINIASSIFSSGDTLVFLMDVADSDATTHQELICADFTSRSVTTLMDFSDAGLDSPNLALMGSFGDKLVLVTRKVNDDNVFVQTLYALDPTLGTIEPLASFPDNERSAFFQNGSIYYIDRSENALYRFDPASRESELLLSKIAPPDLEFDAVQFGYGAPEPYLSFFFTAGETNVNYYWNCDTGEWNKQSLTDGDQEVLMVGIWQDYFLVRLRDKMVSYQDFTPDGQAYTNQMAVRNYALIAQEDYWAGIPNYIRFTDDVYGN